jgi:hypothetical protein
MKFTDLSLDKFWITVEEEYPAIHTKATEIIALVFNFLHV